MAVRRGQKIKQLCIIEILKKYTDEDHPLSASAICDRLAEMGVSAERKAVYDDIDQLIYIGYDIIKTSFPSRGYFLASREFETPEIYLLADAVRTAKFITPKKSRELVSKLQNMLSVYQTAGIENGLYIDTDSKCTNEEIFYNIDAISRAITAKKKIKFKYGVRVLKENRQIVTEYKERVISPYAQTWQDDHYYLIGNYEKYDNLVHFRIDRMRGTSLTDENARPFSEVSRYTDTFDVADYTKRLFNMYGGEVENIDLRCDKSMLEQITDRFGSDIFIRNVTDTHFSFTAKAVPSEAFITFVMNYGDKIEVEKPKYLRDKIKERAKKIAKIYE
ncbi:MAG: transcriptional regulator [Clostridia bacterium]|nr:transcriptional regulator [Clostridia bacterium]